VSEIRAAHIVAFYLFDVAESADLHAVPPLIGGPAIPARLAPKPATPAYVQYEKPPLSFDGEAVGCAAIDEYRVRVRVFDYGVVSVGLTRSVGDIYAARLFGLIADRLGLDNWKADVEGKLKTLDDIYRFAVEQSSMSRGQFLELTVVLILVLELMLIFMGVMR
jgi:hypothetical protein